MPDRSQVQGIFRTVVIFRISLSQPLIYIYIEDSCPSSCSFKPVKFYDTFTPRTGVTDHYPTIGDIESQKFSNFSILEEEFGQSLSITLTRFQIFNLSSPGRAGEPNTREAGWPQGLAPSLERLCALCKELDSWLNGAPNRVVVLHAR